MLPSDRNRAAKNFVARLSDPECPLVINIDEFDAAAEAFGWMRVADRCEAAKAFMRFSLVMVAWLVCVRWHYPLASRMPIAKKTKR
jgi:hypothetical protein